MLRLGYQVDIQELSHPVDSSVSQTSTTDSSARTCSGGIN